MLVLVILLALVSAIVGAIPAWAQEPTCYMVADAGGGDGTGADDAAEDLLTKVTLSDPDPDTNEVTVGSGTGTFRVEAATFRPGTETLYAANGGRLGTISLETGVYSALPEPAGSGPGAGGLPVEEFDNLDGMIFDPSDGRLYASERRGTAGADLLVRLDPATGAHVPDAFGPDADYVVVEPLGELDDIDDLAISPSNGRMYAIANDNGVGDVLVTIDVETGDTTAIGPTGVDDMEGLTFTPDGTLVGTVGKEGDTGEAIWDIDPATGEASNRREVDNATDYETISCIVFAAQEPEVGSITIVKDVSPEPGVAFRFRGDLGGFTLDENGATATPSSRTFTDLEAGTYEVVEQSTTGWRLTAVTCADPDDGSTTRRSAARATVDLDAGENVVCTFRNTRLAVLGGPTLPPTGIPGLAVLSLIGFALVGLGWMLRITPPLRPVERRGSTVFPRDIVPVAVTAEAPRTARSRTAIAHERGPPRTRSP